MPARQPATATDRLPPGVGCWTSTQHGHVDGPGGPAYAVAGAVTGDQVGYLVGRRYGPGLLAHLPARVHRSGELDRALDVPRRRGAPAVALGRWVAALRALVPGLAGMSGMRRLPFTVANVVGGTLWASAVAVLGYLAGASYRALAQRLGLGSEITLAVLVLVGLVLWWRARRTRANARATAADRDDRREPDPAP